MSSRIKLWLPVRSRLKNHVLWDLQVLIQECLMITSLSAGNARSSRKHQDPLYASNLEYDSQSSPSIRYDPPICPEPTPTSYH